MRRLIPGFYDFTALFMGLSFTYLVLRQIGFVTLDRWILAASVSNLVIARLFRRVIVKPLGPVDMLVAIGIGYANVSMFGFLMMPPLGHIVGFVFGLSYFYVLAPLSIGAHFTMRWADSHDRNSTLRSAHA